MKQALVNELLLIPALIAVVYIFGNPLSILLCKVFWNASGLLVGIF